MGADGTIGSFLSHSPSFSTTEKKVRKKSNNKTRWLNWIDNGASPKRDENAQEQCSIEDSSLKSTTSNPSRSVLPSSSSSSAHSTTVRLENNNTNARKQHVKQEGRIWQKTEKTTTTTTKLFRAAIQFSDNGTNLSGGCFWIYEYINAWLKWPAQ